MRSFPQVQRANPGLPSTGGLAAMGLLAIFAVTPIPGNAAETQSAKSATSSWKTARTIPLKGLKVSLSEPVLVARSKGFLWFPTLVHLGKGNLLAVMSNYADVHTKSSTCLAAWSRDGGLTWSKTEPGLYGDSAVRLKNGDHILLPYYLYPQKAGMGAPYQVIPDGKEELRVAKKGVTVTGWPRLDRTLDPKVGMSGFVFNGQTVALKDGGYLATLYGYFKNEKRYSLVAAKSADGIHWKIRSTIAGDKCKLKGVEGPCEAALCRLKDTRLMCVFRLASNVPYGQTWSKDEGKTWTKPVAMANAFSVQPSLAVMKDGTVALSGGRPGIYAWFNRDGTGKDWQRIDLLAHHNACRPMEKIGPVERTSSYTEIVALDERNLLCIYDRIPKGWHAIPKDAKDTNSVWIVRLTLEKAGKPLPK